MISQSKCVLNPSLFEGGAQRVEESKSVGKKIILSDLAVHREQGPEGALFFSGNDPDELACKIKEAWQNLSAGPDNDLEIMAQKNLPERMKGFARDFISVCEEAVVIKRSR